MELDNERIAPEKSSEDTLHGEASPKGALGAQVAGILRRALSACLDLLGAISAGLILVVEYASMNLAAKVEPHWSLLDQVVDIVVRYPGFTWLVIQSVLGSVLCWHLFFMVSVGRTPGHLLMGLRLLDRHGRRPTALQVFVHGLSRLGSLCFFCGAHVWFFVDPERRTLYDRLAGLYVVVHSPQRISE